MLLNLLLGQRLVSGWERTPSTDLHILAVPGGEAVIFQGADPRAADLILTNLIRRTYPIDERILAPALTRVGVSKLGRVVVLEADHGALDDLLRVTRTYHADSFLVAPELQNAVADVLLHQGIPYPIDLVAADSCLSVRSEEIRFHLGDVDLTYVRSSRPALGAAVGEQSDVLLLGRQAAARTGPAEIVARVAVGSNWLDSDRDLSAPVSGADYSASRFDLAYFGALRIRVLDGRRDSLQTRLYP